MNLIKNMLLNENPFRSIYTPVPGQPMRIVFFVSGSGGNLNCGIRVQAMYPEKIKIALVVADRPGIKAIDLAMENGIPVIMFDFEQEVGIYKECRRDKELYEKYQRRSVQFHDRILEHIAAHEERYGKTDLAVLSYRRIIRGRLLEYFENRMINQHPGDLTLMDPSKPLERVLTGYDPVMKAMKLGQKATRTSTIMVRPGMDTGEILAQGPELFFESGIISRENATAHEQRQKEISDWVVLPFVLKGLAEGRFSISANAAFEDGCRRIRYDSVLLPYGGFDVKENKIFN